MDDATLVPFPSAEVCLTPDTLGQLMPMFLWVAENGVIRAAGLTLQKVTGQPLAGRPFDEVFRVKRPRGALPADLAAGPGQRIQLDLASGAHRCLRGTAVPLLSGDGVLLNLSFGISVAEAVREHDLNDGDFAPTDLAVEMLYLIEANAAVAKENQALNLRLQGARDVAEAAALTDTLTGLGNRRAMERALEAASLDRRPFGLLHIDLDHFKAVNDSYGHAAGDHVLRELARRLVKQVRPLDTLARIGGDEFVLILPNVVQPPRLAALGERLISVAAHPMVYEGRSCRISLSIGAATSLHFPDPVIMMEEADRALYASKHAGRARFTLALPDVPHPAMAQRLR